MHGGHRQISRTQSQVTIELCKQVAGTADRQTKSASVTCCRRSSLMPTAKKFSDFGAPQRRITDGLLILNAVVFAAQLITKQRLTVAGVKVLMGNMPFSSAHVMDAWSTQIIMLHQHCHIMLHMHAIACHCSLSPFCSQTQPSYKEGSGGGLSPRHCCMATSCTWQSTISRCTIWAPSWRLSVADHDLPLCTQ